MNLIQLKKKINDQMKNDGLTDEEKIDYCYNLQEDKTAPIEVRYAANRIFCSLIDVHGWLCGMANARTTEASEESDVRSGACLND